MRIYVRGRTELARFRFKHISRASRWITISSLILWFLGIIGFITKISLSLTVSKVLVVVVLVLLAAFFSKVRPEIRRVNEEYRVELNKIRRRHGIQEVLF